MEIQFESGEKIIQSGWGSQGGDPGMLLLTSKRLIFLPRRAIAQNEIESIAFVEVDQVEKSNTLGIVPNSIQLLLKGGEKKQFSVSEREDWIEKISNLLGS